MKKWVKISLGVTAGIAAFVGLLFAAVMYFTSGLVDTTDAFFEAVRHKDFAKARSYLSEELDRNADDKALAEFLANGVLLDFQSSSWDRREVQSNRGRLNGSITSRTGGVVPLQVTLVKERGIWKIYAMHSPTAGLQPGHTHQSLPSQDR